jgi:hypothetical protein
VLIPVNTILTLESLKVYCKLNIEGYFDFGELDLYENSLHKLRYGT